MQNIDVSLMPLICITIPIAGSVLILISYRYPNLREFWSITASIILFFSVVSMLPAVLENHFLQTTLINIAPNISLSLKCDSVGIIFALSASFLWILTSLFSIGYMRGLKEHKQTRYYASFALAIASTMGIALASNLLTFLIFFECLTIATYPLIIHKETKEAISGGRKYLAYLLTGGVSLLLAIAITFQITGTLDFKPQGFISQETNRGLLTLLFVLYTVGFGMKSAIIPLHSWLPTAMIAPTPVSALLHAVAVVKAGVFGFIRLIGFVFGPELFHNLGAGTILSILAAITIIVSSLLAFYQDNLKRRLAYSTIGHLSYIILGISLFSPTSWAGGMLHMVNHAMLKITLFFCAGAIYVNSHIENISELKGIGKQMPYTMLAFTIATIGIVGIPPMNGFISKWYLTQGSLSSDVPFYAIILLLSGLLNAGYLVPIIRNAYFYNQSKSHLIKEAPLIILVPLMITALVSFILGFMPDIFFNFYRLIQNSVNSIF